MGAYSYTVNTSSGTAMTNVAGGGIAWSSVNDGRIQDGLNASVALGISDISDYIDSQKYTGFPTLSGIAVITGVMVEAYMYADIADVAQATECYLTEATVQQTGPEDAGKPIPDAPDWGAKGCYWGGDGVMWGLTSAQMKTLLASKFFGTQFWVQETSGSFSPTVYVDDTRVTVYYDIPRRQLCALGAG